jgi:hypothetical protein
MEFLKNLLLFEQNDYSNATNGWTTQATNAQESIAISSGINILM